MKNGPTTGSELSGMKLSANLSRNNLQQERPVCDGKAFLAMSPDPETTHSKLM